MTAEPPPSRTYGLATLWVTLLGLAVPAPGGAQQTGAVNGTVRDAGTLAPVSGAQVLVVGTG